MYKTIIPLLFVVYAAALFAEPISVAWTEKNVPVLEPLEDHYHNNFIYDFLIDDYDRDGRLEIAELRKTKDHPVMLSVRNIESNDYALPASKINYAGRIKPNILWPLHGHPLFKMLLYAWREDHGMVLLFDHTLQPVDSVKTIRGYDTTGTGEWNGSFYHPHLVDLNGDQRLDLVFIINTAGDGQPRALLGYDLLTKEKVLDRRFAPMAIDLELVDFYNDGTPKLLLTLGGASDGPFFGEFLRNESYLVLLNLDGSTVKAWPHPGSSTYIQFKTVDLTLDNIPEIAATFYSHDQGSGLASSLQIIDGKTLDILDFYTSSNSTLELNAVYAMRVAHQPRILSTSPDGILNLFRFDNSDSSLVLEKSIHIPECNVGRVHITDINDDGSDEIIFYNAANPRLIILDALFTARAMIPMVNFSSELRFFILKHKGKEDDEIIFRGDGKLYRVALPKRLLFPPPPLQVRFNENMYSFSWVPVIVVLLVLAASGAVLYYLILGRNRSLRYSLANSSRVGAIIVNPSRRIVWVNAAFLSAFTLTKSPTRIPINDFFKMDIMAPLDPVWSTFENTQGAFLHREVQFLNHGERRTFGIEISRLFRGYIQILLIDIHETSQTQRLNMWASLAQRLVHKTKTPVASMMLSAQRMQRQAAKYSGELPEIVDPFVKMLLGELDKVRRDINNFLRFSRLQEASVETLDVQSMLTETADAFSKRLPEGVSFHRDIVDEPLTAHLDRKQMIEALSSFLENALSATKGAGNIVLTLHYVYHPLGVKNQSRAMIEIVDDGVGIKEEDLEKIFKAGYSTFEGGSGMGMMIAKMIIEQNGGVLEIKSRENIGTTVTVSFPAGTIHSQNGGEL